MAPNGSFEDFPYDRYTEFISEHIDHWTYLKFPYAKNWGGVFVEAVQQWVKDHTSG